jgi:mannose-6-phosphate isomerase-like protein (cupin superfamily)
MAAIERQLDSEGARGHMTTVQIIDTESLRPETGGAPLFEGARHGGVQTSFFVVSSAPGRGPRLHRHPYEEVFVFLEGDARVWVGDQVVEAHGGQIVVVPAGAAHRFVNIGGGPLRTVNIHPRDHMITNWLEAR